MLGQKHLGYTGQFIHWSSGCQLVANNAYVVLPGKLHSNVQPELHHESKHASTVVKHCGCKGLEARYATVNQGEKIPHTSTNHRANLSTS